MLNYMTPRTLAENAIFVGGASGRLLEQAAALAREANKKDEAEAEAETKDLNIMVGVPRMPDLESYYTHIGPGVVAPWKPGGAPFALLNPDPKTLNSLGGPKHLGIRLRVCDVHVIHPYSVKFMASIDDIGPAGKTPKTEKASQAFPSAHYNQEPHSLTHSGFPHCMEEVARRWYANKNRTDPLWWYVNMSYNDSVGGADLATVKNVLRSKIHAKVQHAFKTALARRGYSASGWRLPQEGVRAKYGHLFGSVRVDAVLQRVLNVSYEDLVAYMTGLMPFIEADLGGRGEIVDGAVVYSGGKADRTYRPYKAQPNFKQRPKGKR